MEFKIVNSLFLFHGCPETKGTGKNDIGVVERRKILDRFPRELQTQSEHVIVVPAEQLSEVFSFVLPGFVVRGVKAVRESLLVLLLFGLV